jgi:hypothetical protein
VSLAGQVTGKIEVLGEAHIRGTLDIDRDLDLAFAAQGADLDGAMAFRLSSAAAHVIDVEADGAAGAGTFALGLGETAIHSPEPDGFDLDVPGATVEAALAQGQPLRLTGIGLGDRTTVLSRLGAPAVTIDLNPEDGRSLDATISHDAGVGLETLRVMPRLDLRMTVDHAVLGDVAPVYDVTRVLLDGGLEGSETNDQVRVLDGSFAITTTPAQYGFSATAGQCVTGADVYDPNTGSYYTQWSVGACL